MDFETFEDFEVWKDDLVSALDKIKERKKLFEDEQIEARKSNLTQVT